MKGISLYSLLILAYDLITQIDLRNKLPISPGRLENAGKMRINATSFKDIISFYVVPVGNGDKLYYGFANEKSRLTVKFGY